MLTQLWRDPFPGMKNAAIAFTIFCVCEWGWKKMTALQRIEKPKPMNVYDHAIVAKEHGHGHAGHLESLSKMPTNAGGSGHGHH